MGSAFFVCKEVMQTTFAKTCEEGCKIREKRYDHGQGIGALIPPYENVIAKVYATSRSEIRELLFTRHLDIRTGSMFLLLIKQRDFMDTGEPSTNFGALDGEAWARPPGYIRSFPSQDIEADLDRVLTNVESVVEQTSNAIEQEPIPSNRSIHHKFSSHVEPWRKRRKPKTYDVALTEETTEYNDYTLQRMGNEARKISVDGHTSDEIVQEIAPTEHFSCHLIDSESILNGENGYAGKDNSIRGGQLGFDTASNQQKTKTYKSESRLSTLDSTKYDSSKFSAIDIPDYTANECTETKSNPRNRFKSIVASTSVEEDLKQLKRREMEFAEATARREEEARLADENSHPHRRSHVESPEGIHPERLRLLNV
ncbi:hypothetical protein EDC01DRAFT_630643 [Geopyxis carbonaria]|nr:hypothetical protein EDC01DRAFT_630643 [Geopyxis carbonaria]